MSHGAYKVFYLQPMPEHALTELEFVDATVGMNIPKNFIPSIEKVRHFYVYIDTYTLTRSDK